MLCLFGPRTGSKTVSLTIPENLAPGPLQTLLPIKVALSESLPPGKTLIGEFNGRSVSAGRWLDRIETRLIPLAGGAEGGFLFRQANALYLTTLPDPEFLGAIIATLAAETGLETTLLPPDLRRRRLQSLEFFFNYGPDEIPLPLMGNGEPGKFLIGGPRLKPADVAVRMAG
jgi:beta-galactosidase